MEATIKGGKLIITIDFNEAGTPSASGKTNVHASTRGNLTSTVKVNGKTLVVGLNAYTAK
jgi:hypothetical protein